MRSPWASPNDPRMTEPPNQTAAETVALCSRCREVPPAEDSFGMCRLCANLDKREPLRAGVPS